MCCIRPGLATHSRSHSTHTLRCAECLDIARSQRVPGLTGGRDGPVPGDPCRNRAVKRLFDRAVDAPVDKPPRDVSSYLEFMPSGRTAVRRESSRHNGLNPMKIDVQRHYRSKRTAARLLRSGRFGRFLRPPGDHNKPNDPGHDEHVAAQDCEFVGSGEALGTEDPALHDVAKAGQPH
jgi:hypothetical protein